MPVAEFSGDHGLGYDGVDLFAPHHAYGGPAALKRLVDACHTSGLGVVLDVVYNHIGPVGNFLSEFAPYFSERHHTNWGAAFNFDDRRAMRCDVLWSTTR
jgi:maltooligosyltrehalose trehalohydrolase